MEFKIAICDDDAIVHRQIKKLLEGEFQKYVIDEYNSGEELVKSEKKYDLIFLDIEMDKLNGLRTAKLLRNKKREDYIVFLTSHLEFMSEAFKVKAFRFLSKPIQEEKFFEALKEAEKEKFIDEKIVVPSLGMKYMIDQRDIVYIESLGDGTCVYTEEGEYVTTKTLKYWEEALNQVRFFKIHKSFLIGMQYVKIVSQTHVQMGVKEISIPIARRQKTEFQKVYMQYVREYSRIL